MKQHNKVWPQSEGYRDSLKLLLKANFANRRCHQRQPAAKHQQSSTSSKGRAADKERAPV
jgi:hypothetical protein